MIRVEEDACFNIFLSTVCNWNKTSRNCMVMKFRTIGGVFVPEHPWIPSKIQSPSSKRNKILSNSSKMSSFSVCLSWSWILFLMKKKKKTDKWTKMLSAFDKSTQVTTAYCTVLLTDEVPPTIDSPRTLTNLGTSTGCSEVLLFRVVSIFLLWFNLSIIEQIIIHKWFWDHNFFFLLLRKVEKICLVTKMCIDNRCN